MTSIIVIKNARSKQVRLDSENDTEPSIISIFPAENLRKYDLVLGILFNGYKALFGCDSL